MQIFCRDHRCELFFVFSAFATQLGRRSTGELISRSGLAERLQGEEHDRPKAAVHRCHGRNCPSYLESDRSPPESMLISDLDGFLTAVAIGPELIKPSEWLRVIWGGEQPIFADENEAQAVLDAIMNRYNQILRDVERHSLEPIFWTDPDGTIIAADWAEGFAMAMDLRPKSWEPLFQSRKHGSLLIPILALCSNDEGGSALGLNAEA